MAYEKGKRRKDVGKEREGMRLSRFFTIAVLMALLAAIPSLSFTALAAWDTDIETEMTEAEEPKTFDPKDISTEVQVHGELSALNHYRVPDKSVFERTSIATKEMEASRSPDIRSSDTVPKVTSERTSKPSPQGSPDPEPTDAPFMANDVLVYTDPANSQKNASMANTSDGSIFVTYDHDIGTGLRDVYVSKSTDGGSTWVKQNLAVDPGENERCPSIAGDYVSDWGTEALFVFYTQNNFAEMQYSVDNGATWNVASFPQSVTYGDLTCPYVAVKDNTWVIISEFYNPSATFTPDTMWLWYTLDAGATFDGYWFDMWDGIELYRPRVTILDDDEILLAIDVYDFRDPFNPTWDALFGHGTIGLGGGASDIWEPFHYYMYGALVNPDPVHPSVEASGPNGEEVIFLVEISDPAATGANLATNWINCRYWNSFDTLVGKPPWLFEFCGGTGVLAWDWPSDTKDQKYGMFHKEGTAVYAVWLNGTDINYYYSPNGGANLEGDPAGGPYKVNQPGVGTALDAWHSPDVTFVNGKPAVAWHDTRGGDSIYFNTWVGVIQYTLKTNPYHPELKTWEVGQNPEEGTHSYTWVDGSSHSIEATPQYDDGQTSYTFNHWEFDDSVNNPETYVVGGAATWNTANYSWEFMLTMIGGGGNTIPLTGWQARGANVTIECLIPPPPGPGSSWTFLGWTGIGDGSYTGTNNPWYVIMNGSIMQMCTWQKTHEVNIYTIPSGLQFSVTGGVYVGNPKNESDNPFTFVDSEVYTLDTPSPQWVSPVERLEWQSWSDLGPKMHNVAVTEPTNFTAYFTPEYNITLITNPAGLVVTKNLVNYTTPYSWWCSSGTLVWLDVLLEPQDFGVPGEHYVWANWSDGGAKMHQYTCNGPEVLTANFTKRFEVTITTSPLLPMPAALIIDGSPQTPPHTVWWDEGISHTLEAPQSVSTGAGQRLNFSYWDDLGARIHDYTPTGTETVTAYYKDQRLISLRASHANIQIRLDSSTVALPYNYWCDFDTNHFLEADSLQFLGSHTQYVYESWDDLGNQNHWFTCSDAKVITVIYREEFRVYINSTVDGAPQSLDVSYGGTTYSTPVELWRTSNEQNLLETNEFQPGTDPMTGTRYKFVDWDDSDSRSRTVTINSAPMEFVANFKTQHKLVINTLYGTPQMNPPGEAEGNGYYYDEGTVVTISIDDVVPDTADHRYRFYGWTGIGYTGSDNPTQITMDAPITQTVAYRSQYLLTLDSVYGTLVASGYNETHATVPNAYWYVEGDLAVFEVERLVQIAVDEKAEFKSWTGVIPGNENATSTTMNQAKVVTANWDLYYLVTVASLHGTVQAPEWVIHDGSLPITIEAMVYDGDDTRYVFKDWSSLNASKGGYSGDEREHTLTLVTGPIMETANWITEYRVSFTHYVNNVQATAPTGANPKGDGWFRNGTLFHEIEVAGSTTEGDWIYTFDKFTGPGVDDTNNKTMININEPMPLNVYWLKEKKEEANIFAELWWLWVVIIIVIVVVVVAALMMRKKPAAPAEEVPPPVEEEVPAEEPTAAPEEAPSGAPPPPA